MVETPYALQKFINARQIVYGKEEAEATEFLFNCETVTTFNNLQEISNICQKNKNYIDGIVFGRVDFVGSLGLSRNDIESDQVSNSVLKVSRECQKINLDFVVGGAVSFDAKENLKKFKECHLTRFETRKMIFESKALNLKGLEQALKDAVYFELLWLFNKREYYNNMYKEDDKRIQMLESRWKVLNSN